MVLAVTTMAEFGSRYQAAMNGKVLPWARTTVKGALEAEIA